ncbi:MAG: secretin N-terminal domain-containing protein [Nitrosomonadales bacterium]|nr:secretin N-terminal domain-containing protein [Nitrosomonadales bacterium]
MKQLYVIVLPLLLAACASGGGNTAATKIKQEMDAAVQESAVSGKPDAGVSQALLPPLSMNNVPGDSKPVEARFDLAVNNTSASQVFMAIVSGTRYSMLVHPDVAGAISLNLKDVTVFDALESIRELYGYDYRVDGSRIYIQPLTLQTRIFQVSYLTGLREGKSSLRVASGSVADVAVGSAGTGAAANANRDSSKVTMTSSADFWDELTKTLAIIVGTEKGRSVVVSPMSGVIVVRAMPDELKNIAAYLKASQLSIERQVILEAKIIEVKLSDTFQTGVNWSAFKNGPNSALSGGSISSGTTLANSGSLTNGILTGTPGSTLSSLAATSLPTGSIAGTMFGLAFQTSNFAALLNFLEGQGDVHVLSSPRIATLNNQKAVLKVGTDEFYVTEVTGGTQSTTTTTGTAPTVKVQPFFSGISLDVTPRIDENNEIILHVHPSVSTVSTVNKTLNLGTTMGTYNLPLASSSISETDSVVRARDGQIVAIGGLMRQATIYDESGLPMLPKTLFGQTNKTTEKRELVILLKPTVVDSDKDWSDAIGQSRDRINSMSR